jgi:hypothetical protein
MENLEQTIDDAISGAETYALLGDTDKTLAFLEFLLKMAAYMDEKCKARIRAVVEQVMRAGKGEKNGTTDTQAYPRKDSVQAETGKAPQRRDRRVTEIR